MSAHAKIINEKQRLENGFLLGIFKQYNRIAKLLLSFIFSSAKYSALFAKYSVLYFYVENFNNKLNALRLKKQKQK